MALEIGSRLGHYDVTALIGEGGMGQVYQATDTKLNRQVALKILPEAFADDPDRLARFQREAQVLASLNHPGIAAIYGLEDSGDTKALVLELVEGPTLADRIKRGPIPLDEALPIAKQIAEALEAAHEAGVIHRDLKPANIKVREDGMVKVLDFGLAKALDPNPESDPSQSPTLTAAATQMGVIMGTAAYMSPEQAAGKTVDTRTDVWSFGAVVFEMLSGGRAFDGETVSETLAAVHRGDVDLHALPAETPARFRRVMAACLQRDLKQRIHNVADLRLALTGAFDTGDMSPSDASVEPARPIWQQPAGIVLILALATLASFMGWSLRRPAVTTTDVVRFSITPTPEPTYLAPGRDLAVSPDGAYVVYTSIDSGALYRLNVRALDQAGEVPLRGGEGGVAPFFSADSDWVGFVGVDGRTIYRVPVGGGRAVVVTESPHAIQGASWGDDDLIVFGTRHGLFGAPAAGGEPDPLTTPQNEDESHMWPSIIPGREAVMFVVSEGDPLRTGQLAAVNLDTGEIVRLGLTGVSPRYVSTGHLVYATEEGSMRAVPFDSAALAVRGAPVLLTEGVVAEASGAADFSVSSNGSLVYAPAGARAVQRSLVWVDREGREEPIAAPPREYFYPRVSPDGTRVAIDVRDQEQDIWIWDFTVETLTRLTLDPALDVYGHWTADGERVLFSSQRSVPVSLYWKTADGTGEAERLTESEISLVINAVTPDGDRAVVRSTTPDRQNDLFTVDLQSGAVKPLFATAFDELNAAVSPDGNWLAYESNESGQYEVYVRPFPNVEAGRRQISTAGGRKPVWGPTGRELFYLDLTGRRLLAVSVEGGPLSATQTSEVLFEGNYLFAGVGRNFDVAPDGRFLMIKDIEPSASPTQISAQSSNRGYDARQRINVVLNWHEELKDRVPVP